MNIAQSIVKVPRRHARERGVVLVISLIVLVAMTLAGIAAWRSIGTGLLIAGNMAFQQGATQSADKGIEAARAWLTDPANLSALAADQPQGYLSTWQSSFNPQTFNWTAQGLSTGAPDATGNSVTYVIHRLCNSAGQVNAPGQQCVSILTSGGAMCTEIDKCLSGTIQPYYRVTVRVAGPRNTFSYVQSTMF